MGPRSAFNLDLALICTVAFVLTSGLAYNGLQTAARQQMFYDAGLIIETGAAIRGYTVAQVAPHLETEMAHEFLPQSVPSYAATETLTKLKQHYGEFSYKEAALNPTNPRDRALPWEADLVRQFKDDSGLSELRGEVDTPLGRAMYIARPIRPAEACLACHSKAEAAPRPMIALYGENNGFGWQARDVVGVQVISVPLATASAQGQRQFYRVLHWLAGLFVLIFGAIHLRLGRAASTPPAATAPPGQGRDTAPGRLPLLKRIADVAAFRTTRAGPGQAMAPTHGHLHADVLQQAERLLLPSIGPVAKVLVSQAATRADSEQTFSELLAQHIPKLSQREAFLRAMALIRAQAASRTTPSVRKDPRR